MGLRRSSTDGEKNRAPGERGMLVFADVFGDDGAGIDRRSKKPLVSRVRFSSFGMFVAHGRAKKGRNMLRLSVGLLLVSGVVFFAFESTSRSARGEASVPKVASRDESAAQDIEGLMRTIKSNLETLTTKIEEPKEKKTVLEAFSKLEAAFLASKDVLPPRLENVKEAEKEAFIAEYRKFQADAVKMCLDAEKKYLDNKAKDAKKMVRDIEALKGKGHGKFK